VSARSSQVTGAELLALTAIAAAAALIVWPYVLDRLGAPLLPSISAMAAGAAAAVVVFAFYDQAKRAPVDMTLFAASFTAMAGYLLWLAWPDLLPTGSGPDLTHHLLLIDYIEQQGHLVRDVEAGALLGEMAHYTPGLHLTTVIAAAIARTDGFHALYPVIVFTVALKLGFVSLILLRLFSGAPMRAPLAAAGVLLVFAIPAFSVASFRHDSFFAQVVSELFAIALWWTLIVWDKRPTLSMMSVFAIAAMAAFLTWPVWLGPPVLSLLILTATRRDLERPAKLAHLVTAFAPLVVVAALHAIGRTGWVSIVATSGAVAQPSVAAVGWWFAALASGGFIVASVSRQFRAVVVFSGAIALQAFVLWLVASRAGAETPYMAIKMTYLAIYPAIASAILAVSTLWNLWSRVPRLQRLPTRAVQGVAWIVVVGIALLVTRQLANRPAPSPVVSNDLWRAGNWARDNLPADCVDYLVASDYTAYWLHLAVLGNSRSAARTADDDTFLTQPSMARWLMPAGMTYAVADLSILPTEIRREVDVLQQFGNAAVITRRGPSSCP
jgi:hypothetical protein